MGDFSWSDGTDTKDPEGRLAYILITQPAAKLLTLFKLKNGRFYGVCLGKDRLFATTDLDTAKREAMRWFCGILATLSLDAEKYLMLIEQ